MPSHKNTGAPAGMKLMHVLILFILNNFTYEVYIDKKNTRRFLCGLTYLSFFIMLKFYEGRQSGMK